MKPIQGRSIAGLPLALALLATCACNFVQSVGSTGQPSAPGTESEAVGPETAGGFEGSPVQPWLAETLSLRSITLSLETTRPGGDPIRLTAEVDSAGNLHLTFPISVSADLAPTPIPEESRTIEMYVIDGVSYSRTGMEGPATPDATVGSVLEQALRGPDGPGMWLSLLPAEAISPGGNETYGGFESTRYDVDGQIEEGSVQGTIWLEDGSSALVGADLTVSESLFYPPDSGHEGEVRIVLEVTRAEVPAITLP